MSMLLEIRDLTVRYGGVTAVSGVSLAVPEGKIVTLIGANGAGKSTIINAVSGMVPRTGGEILFDGSPLKPPPEEIVRRGVVQVPEGRRIFPSITVRENLVLGAYLDRDAAAVRRRIDEVCAMFPVLAERRKQAGGTLSGGEQQMLAIARGLMASPRLLLLDEPSLGLAPKFIAQIFRLIKDLNEKGLTIVLVEQNALKALSIAHYAFVLETGRLVHQGEAADVAGDPAVRKAYLGCED
jgi:branched-chain amino acid transport system ATP-binding protein